MDCPCGSGRDHEECCGAVMTGERPAATAEELMRARYSGYVLGDVDFVIASMHPDRRGETDPEGIRDWSENSQWHGLEIVSTSGGGPDDAEGEVEFVADYTFADKRHRHHERATFERHEGRWFFVDGETVKSQPFVREQAKVGRNDPCPCGSGLKSKKCCGR
ncbi:MAG: YchJ family protein [Candidatus Krumholzibacteriia bacterium]